MGFLQSLWNTISNIFDLLNLSELSVAEQVAMTGGLALLRTLPLHVKTPVVSIPIPKTIVSKVQKATGIFLDTPAVQGLIGAAFAALVTKLMGWTAVDIAAYYTGVDAVMKAIPGLYAVVEAKGGTAKLGDNQMSDGWIQKGLNKAINENPGIDANRLRAFVKPGGVLAIVISTNLRGSSPTLKFQMQTYRGVTAWDI